MDKTIKPTNPQMDRECRYCKYFDTLTNIAEHSQVTVCRKNPPKAYAQLTMEMQADGRPVPKWQQCTLWPLVQPSDYCGEFARKLQS